MELLSDLFQVTLVGIILGAGLPILFGLAIRFSVPAQGLEGHPSEHIPAWQRALAGLLFLIIIAAVVLGLLWITQGRLYDTFGWDIFGTGGTSGH
ncbi:MULTISPECIES: hypothetical protein [Corynebacterium]|jgi:ABC-type antimicrobial peptide transport system permease subunit|uniref:Uncharacterized protein n=1 Tax=Corynebacterium provencense TaxID=1737425 RepID=A0A2Z3YV80_9CORY|nr:MULTISPECIES: hypothetical protein [Corynebacterium]AWT25363.1 hypothetical protein Csp1_05450 [Corynebacterium provencense]MCI1256251.1 hypothetical protein [Corynebacterium provencense]